MVTDVVILGGGFGGCLTALIARQIGLSVVVVDRGFHPRFAIGESSTPTAGVILRDLAARYDLPQLVAISDYGNWQKSVPDLVCGIKRGFSYFGHQIGERFVPDNHHQNELLVTASANDEQSDTHWLRADVDSWMAEQAQVQGVEVLERVELTGLSGVDPWVLQGVQAGRTIEVRGHFLVDATGAASLLPKWLSLRSMRDCLRTQSWAVFSHFHGVTCWHEWLRGQHATLHEHPFCCDHAALHHWLDAAWMWNLRFQDERVSAGFVMDLRRHEIDRRRAPRDDWESMLERYPAIGDVFADAQLAELPGSIIRTSRLQRLWGKLADLDWALLPHTAGFIDPLHSTGIAHTLCGIERLAAAWSECWGQSGMAEKMADYDRIVRSELLLIDQLVSNCYDAPDFSTLTACAMLYFAAATTYERQRPAQSAAFESAFLCANSVAWRQAVATVSDWLQRLGASPSPSELRLFEQRVAVAIRPFNQVGLFAADIMNMYRHTAAPVSRHA
ncbi:MAG: hypothetical protein CMJ75_05625 [Planctomycetaceae bacterium]|nr:hypothetical protein [Planctomycetaceae bacterium]